jgi:predicted DNA-binding transcriptional regulator YafY
LSIKILLIPLASNELLDIAPCFRRERSISAAGLATSFNMVVTRRAKAFNSDRHSIAGVATRIINRCKFSLAAQRLTPELTRREASGEAFDLANDMQADSARVE